DCNLPSGESLLRQMLIAHNFCNEHFGKAPEVAWLPDSFGFANTLPTLLAHAGIRYFVTTKLQWNDTTRFPYPQFRWRGPDGSQVIGALIDSYDGGLNAWRIARARARREPVVAGYGDGGGGVTEEMIRQARALGRWTRPIDWLRTLDADSLPPHDDELYLEYHRGAYTTHHDIKQRNARLERMLLAAENVVAYDIASGRNADEVGALCRRLDEAWRIVLRNQFHDVLPGTSIREVYVDVHHEYDRGEALVKTVLQRSPAELSTAPALAVPKVTPGGAFLFDNGLIQARVSAEGSIDALQLAGRESVVKRANLLTLYRDRPRQWDAWNIDADYRLQSWSPNIGTPNIVDGALVIPLTCGKSQFQMRVTLRDGEPFLRIALSGDWRERHTLMRIESLLSIDADRVVYGTPHGTIERSALNRTAQERAKFEVPGQRFGLARADDRAVAILALDTYGWSAVRDANGLHLGHSLLRSPMWPHPDADAGRQTVAYAFAPLDDKSIGSVERLWERFAGAERQPLFSSDNPAVIIAACKPAHDGRGVILRIRECDGAPCEAHLTCERPIASVERVDALERSLNESVASYDRGFRTTVRGFELQSFRILFNAA
ncbi:MAG: alpha-mannosidase, partial [Candidatus Eremiobacteraeota bacterium]|nr:alpha-mannosidase [Candidatus Eremiobacteraeota bacterium]